MQQGRVRTVSYRLPDGRGESVLVHLDGPDVGAERQLLSEPAVEPSRELREGAGRNPLESDNQVFLLLHNTLRYGVA